MTLEPGDIVLVPFPFTDHTSRKRRPALVVSDRTFNEDDDVFVCGITSNLRESRHSVLIEQADLTSGALPQTSRIKAGKLVTIRQQLVQKVVGRVDARTLAAVRKELRALLQ